MTCDYDQQEVMIHERMDLCRYVHFMESVHVLWHTMDCITGRWNKKTLAEFFQPNVFRPDLPVVQLQTLWKRQESYWMSNTGGERSTVWVVLKRTVSSSFVRAICTLAVFSFLTPITTLPPCATLSTQSASWKTLKKCHLLMHSQILQHITSVNSLI